MREEVILQ